MNLLNFHVHVYTCDYLSNSAHWPLPHQVRTWKMHLYTIIQLSVIGLLWGLKLSEASMVYPLVIVFLIPLKWLLGKFVFSKQEMEAVSP